MSACPFYLLVESLLAGDVVEWLLVLMFVLLMCLFFGFLCPFALLTWRLIVAEFGRCADDVRLFEACRWRRLRHLGCFQVQAS